MSEEKKCKKSIRKSTRTNEHKCTCDTNGCCSNSTDIPSDVLGAAIRDVPDSALSEVYKADMSDILSIIEDYCSSSGKTFDDIATALSEEECRKNEKLFVDMSEKVEDAIKTFMQRSTDSDEIKNSLLKEMFNKLTSLYISSTLKNKIDEWKKAQKHTCADIKDKINKYTKEDKKDVPKVVLKSLEDIFPWLKDEEKEVDRSAPDYEIEGELPEEYEDDGDSEYLKDFDFPFTYKDEERNIKINADIIGESNDSICIQIETEYEDKDICISQTTEISYDRDENLFKFFADCLKSITDICRTKYSCCNLN